MSDLISREEVLKAVDNLKIRIEPDVLTEYSINEVLSYLVKKVELRMFDRINRIPTIEAVPVVHGEWIKSDLLFEADKCTICNSSIYNTSGMNFCPNCGADMRKGGA